MPAYRALTRAEYLHTMSAPMRRLAADAPPPVVVSVHECAHEAWSLAHPELDAAAVDAALEAAELEHVYVSADGGFTHLLLAFGAPNVFLVIVVDNAKAAVHGHHRLDLKGEYGL